MRRVVALASLFVLLVAPPGQLTAAPRWCAAHPNAGSMVFCEDWDRNCYEPTPPPADPSEACPVDACCGGSLLPDNVPWIRGTLGGLECRNEDGLISSPPFSGRTGGSQWTGAAMTAGIHNRFGPNYPMVRGTDLTPLIFEYVLDFRPQEAKMSGSNLYMELIGDGGPPPALTDYVLSPDCRPCGGTGSFNAFNHGWPIMCRQTDAQNQTPQGCGPIQDAPILPAIAAGALAYLDTNPCHCGETRDHWPYASHLSFFDGRQWWTLRAGMFPGGGTGGAIPGDFLLHTRTSENDGVPGPMKVRLTVKSTHCKVELTYVTANNPSVEYSWCEIPLAYIGPFIVTTFGCDPSCKVDPNAWTCAQVRVGINQPPTGATTSVDNIALYGGQGEDAVGACCFPNLSCSQQFQGDCAVLGGQFAGGNITCAEAACCPVLPGDSDTDGDVDMSDFSAFQKCLSGSDVEPATVSCQCHDYEQDNDVDAADFTRFLGCLLGADIPANPACLD